MGVLTRVFPPGLLDRVLVETVRVEVRRRALPSRLVVYFVVGMALFSESSDEEVLRQLTEGLSWSGVWGGGAPWVVPTKAAIFRARSRLGVEPFRALFEGACVPLAASGTQLSRVKVAPLSQCWWALRTMVASDSSRVVKARCH